MSRSGLVEFDGDDILEFGRGRGRVASATRGKRGQQFFRDLVAALDALPQKRLIAHVLEVKEGEVCALGAVGQARGMDLSSLDTENHEQLGEAFNIASVLTQEVMWENDSDARWESPEERWKRIRAWAESQIVQSRPNDRGQG